MAYRSVGYFAFLCKEELSEKFAKDVVSGSDFNFLKSSVADSIKANFSPSDPTEDDKSAAEFYRVAVLGEKPRSSGADKEEAQANPEEKPTSVDSSATSAGAAAEDKPGAKLGGKARPAEKTGLASKAKGLIHSALGLAKGVAGAKSAPKDAQTNAIGAEGKPASSLSDPAGATGERTQAYARKGQGQAQGQAARLDSDGAGAKPALGMDSQDGADPDKVILTPPKVYHKRISSDAPPQDMLIAQEREREEKARGAQQAAASLEREESGPVPAEAAVAGVKPPHARVFRQDERENGESGDQGENGEVAEGRAQGPLGKEGDQSGSGSGSAEANVRADGACQNAGVSLDGLKAQGESDRGESKKSAAKAEAGEKRSQAPSSAPALDAAAAAKKPEDEGRPAILDFKPLILRLFCGSDFPMQIVILPLPEPAQKEKESVADYQKRLLAQATEMLVAVFGEEARKISKRPFMRFINIYIPSDDIFKQRNVTQPISRFLEGDDSIGVDEIRRLQTISFVSSPSGVGMGLYKEDGFKMRRMLVLSILLAAYSRTLDVGADALRKLIKLGDERRLIALIRNLSVFLACEFAREPAAARNPELSEAGELLREAGRLDSSCAELSRMLTLLREGFVAAQDAAREAQIAEGLQRVESAVGKAVEARDDSRRDLAEIRNNLELMSQRQRVDSIMTAVLAVSVVFILLFVFFGMFN